MRQTGVAKVASVGIVAGFNAQNYSRDSVSPPLRLAASYWWRSLQLGWFSLLYSGNGANRAQADNLPVAFVLGEYIEGGRAEKFFI